MAKKFILTLPDDLHKKLKVLSAQLGISMNQLIVDLLTKKQKAPSSGR